MAERERKRCNGTGLYKGNCCTCPAGPIKQLQMNIDICTAMTNMMNRLVKEAKEAAENNRQSGGAI
jgi:hypothetical protein